MNARKRLAALLALGLVLVASAAAYIEFHFDLRSGSGPAGPAWPEVLSVHSAYNAAIHTVALRYSGVRVVPMQREFLGHGIHCRKIWHQHYRPADPYYWYAWNIEDPNERGYDAIRRLFLNTLVPEVNALRSK